MPRLVLGVPPTRTSFRHQDHRKNTYRIASPCLPSQISPHPIQSTPLSTLAPFPLHFLSFPSLCCCSPAPFYYPSGTLFSPQPFLILIFTMRLSSSLLVILAAITVSNAAVLDSTLHPRHHLAAVKSGSARVNALDTAKVHTGKVDLKHLDRLVSVHAKRTISVNALGTANANAAVDLKSVAGVVHTLSASLESQSSDADAVLKINDQHLAQVKATALLSSVKSTLAGAIVDLHNLSVANADVSASKTAAVNVNARGLLQAVNLNAVTSLIGTSDIAGSGSLVSLLGGLKLDAILQQDVLSILSNLDVVKTLHDVEGVTSILGPILAVVDTVPLIEALQAIEDPVAFVDALVDVQDIEGLVSAAVGGVSAIVKLAGVDKILAYTEKFTFNTVAKALCVTGVTPVLEAIIALPGSIQLLGSLKTVTDVPALVSGLHAIPDLTGFVSSIQEVADVTSLTSVVSGVVSGVAKRDVEVDAGLARVKALKRAIAHVAALPTSKLVAVNAAVKRSNLVNSVDAKVDALKLAQVAVLERSNLVNGVNANVDALDLAQIAVLKRSIADLSALNEQEIVALQAKVKRDVLSGLNLSQVADLQSEKSLLAGLGVDQVAQIKRDVLNTVDSTVSSIDLDSLLSRRELLQSVDGTISSLDLNRLLAIKRSALLSTIQPTVASVTDLDVLNTLPALKRAIVAADTDFLTKGSLASVKVARAVDANVDVSLVADSLDTLYVDVAGLMGKVVNVVDAVHVEAITTDVLEQVVPLITALAEVVGYVVSVKADFLSATVQKVAQIAVKTTQALA